MGLPSPAKMSELRKSITEANRLVIYLQGTMSLEGQGMDKRRFREIKRLMLRRLLGDS